MKVLLGLTFMIIGLAASPQLNWGVTAGVHASGLREKDLTKTEKLTALHTGLIADFSLTKSGLHLQSGLIYMPMGYAKSDIPLTDINGNQFGIIDKHRISYLQVPAYLVYKIKVDKNSFFNTGFGPFVAFKVGDKLSYKAGNIVATGEVLPAGVKSVNPVIAGLGVRAGFDIGNYLFYLNYQHGLGSIYESQLPSASWKVSNYGVSVAYWFGSK